MENTSNKRTNGIIGGAIYLALGLLVYLWLGTYSMFGWADPWIYIYMALWPIVIIWKAFVLFLIIAIIVVIIVSIGYMLDWW